jgi:3-deoxy-manno-octulosonate cytidylyltransferase (CMP-KDO synthetase)
LSFTVLIPARLASTRLPRKPLADIAGLPMVVRVAQQALRSNASRVVVAADHDDIVAACKAHEITVILTRPDHATGSDRLAECCELLGLNGEDTVVNVQGDEPLIDPRLINACATELQAHSDCVMSTVAHAIGRIEDLTNPNVVKVVLDAKGRALLFSRAPIPWWRDAPDPSALSSPPPLRHVGIYAYRASFLRAFPRLSISPLEVTESLEQLRVLWHGERIAVHITSLTPGPGVDTPADLDTVRALCLHQRETPH